MIDGVIFDCDGVLVDSEILAIEVEQEHLASLGLAYALDDFRLQFLGLHDDEFVHVLNEDSLARRGQPLPSTFLEDVHQRRRKAVGDRLREVPGAARAAAAIKHPKAVASSSRTAFLESKLRRASLWDYFAPHVYSADAVKRGKPAPDIFLHAAHGLGVEPLRTVAIEDSVNGIRSAKAAGMRAWGFIAGAHCCAEDGPRLTAAGAERIVTSFDELTGLLS